MKQIDKPEALKGYMLVILQHSVEIEKKEPSLPEPAREYTDREELERELQYTRENLQSTIEELETSNEELKSSNEELQSINEEMQSSNEELETSKEEMQSLNEELNTVNAELKSKVDALARSNNDMNNLLNNMQMATIFLDENLCVKRYTRKAQDIVRLIDSDIGRPISDLTSSLNYNLLIEDCKQVLETLVPVEREVTDVSGCYFLLRIYPYRTRENVIEGVVLTIVDIDRSKRAEEKATESLEFFESVFQTVRHPLLVLDGELRVVRANTSFYEAFDVREKRTEGHFIYNLGKGQWDIPNLRRILEEVMTGKKVMNDFRVTYRFPRVGEKTFLLNARSLQQEISRPGKILLAMEEEKKEIKNRKPVKQEPGKK